MPKPKISIKVIVHSADLFNGWDDEDSYDVEASGEKYGQMLTKAIKKEYKADVEVDVRHGVGGWHRETEVDCDDWEERDTIKEGLDSIEERLYQDYEWVVKK